MCVEKFFFYHKVVTLPEGWWLCLLSLCLSWNPEQRRHSFFLFLRDLLSIILLRFLYREFGVWLRGVMHSVQVLSYIYSVSLFLSSFSSWPMEPPRSSQGNNIATFTQVPLGLQIPPQTSVSRNFFGRNTMLPWKNSV